MTEYALYKGENLLCVGTLEEIAKERNCNLDTINFFRYPCYKNRIENRKRYKNGVLELVELEEDDE